MGANRAARRLGVGGLERQAARSSRGERRDGRYAMLQCRNAFTFKGLRSQLLRCTMICHIAYYAYSARKSLICKDQVARRPLEPCSCDGLAAERPDGGATLRHGGIES